ncbi:MAG TPA: hypothetical protein VIG99_04020 [Myxococcaceae bacterium]|jgi:hypothetical protein
MRPLGAVAAAALFGACAGGPAPILELVPFHEARLRAVHLDTLDPAHHEEFVAARQEWLAALAAEGRPPDGRGLFLELSDHRIWSLRPLRSMVDLEKRREPDDGERLKPARKRYDDRSDAALRPPHHNEIWAREPDLDFPGEDPALDEVSAGASRVVVEQLLPSPPHGDDYEAAWAEVKAALQARRYPLRRVSYWSRYGSGKLITLWLAHSGEELKATPPPEELVSASVLEKWRSALASSETLTARHRRDLSGAVVP